MRIEQQRQWWDDFIAAGQALAERTPEEWAGMQAGTARSVRVVRDDTVHVQSLRDVPVRAGDTIRLVEMTDGVMRLEVTSAPAWSPCTRPTDGPYDSELISIPGDDPMRSFLGPVGIRMWSARWCDAPVRARRLTARCS